MSILRSELIRSRWVVDMAKMSKMTRKYSTANALMKRLGMAVSGLNDRDYFRLSEKGFQWDSHAGEWIDLTKEHADLPSPLVRIRVWAEKGKAAIVAEDVRQALADDGLYDLVERSEVYPCRPPKQLEERVYLTFMKRRGT